MVTVEIRGGRTVPPPSIEEVMAGANPTPTDTCDGIYIVASGNGFMEVDDAVALADQLMAAVSVICPPPKVKEVKK